MVNIQEPPIDPKHDTQPTGTHRAVVLNSTQQGASMAQRVIGSVILLAALGFTLAAVGVLLWPSLDTDDDKPITMSVTGVPDGDVESEPTQAPTATPTLEVAQAVQLIDDSMPGSMPTLDPETANTLLQTPIASLKESGDAQVERQALNPFTIIPERPRNEVIQHVIEKGDTITALAEFYGLEPESIAWSNPRRIIQVLRPGDSLNIPPIDGVYITAVGSSRTITDYATYYDVADPYDVLNSPFNSQLVGYTPNTVPSSGTQIFFPGGQAEEIVWTANIEVVGGDSSSGSGSAGTVRFQPGDPGDCGSQPISGGSAWVNPVPSGYTITRGFSSWHPGIDLAGAIGTPIVAANGGTVIFSGWNNWGYGYLVVLVHGPNMTVYGHLQDIYVSCGQSVAAGQQIGTMGNSGNSSGPHLHFEIRGIGGGSYNAFNPVANIGF